MRFAVYLIFLASACVPASVVAEAPALLKEIRAKDPINIRPDRAYLLLRGNSKGGSPTFLRVPTPQELAAHGEAKAAAFREAEPDLTRERERQLARKKDAESKGKKFSKAIPPVPSVDNFAFEYDTVRNIQNVKLGRALAKGDGTRTFLLETLPGEFVIYGVGFQRALHTCLCLGTVSFKAKAGEITDLGEIWVSLAANESPKPALAGETGFGPSVNGHIALWAIAVTPFDGNMTVPAKLAQAKRIAAEYQAVGKFVSGFSFNINRMAPIPGILGYDNGDVIDLRNNLKVENHF